jgi:hypothetical protein
MRVDRRLSPWLHKEGLELAVRGEAKAEERHHAILLFLSASPRVVRMAGSRVKGPRI